MRSAKRKIAILLCLCLALTALVSVPAFAAGGGVKVVRVGWYESPFNTTDDYGRRSGYAYEYQQRIAAHTGWSYEYVEGSWSELLAKLQRGEIDILSDVSYTAARAGKMLFSELPMGVEEYYAFVSSNNTDISADDFATFNGKRVGVNQNSIQESFFREWMQRHDIDAEIVELSVSGDEAIAMLQRGDIDALVTLDVYGGVGDSVPVCKIGESNFYFAVNKNRLDLQLELDEAMGLILSEEPTYNQELHDKYVRVNGANLYLTSTEKLWLSRHGAIHVGYQENYLSFCATDEEGNLTGALKDYLEYASTCLENAELEFKPVGFATASEAMEALNKREIDCVFPANLSAYDGEELGVMMTPAFMRTEMYAVVRAADQRAFDQEAAMTVAVNGGNPNYETFLMDHFPQWNKVYYDTTAECIKAVAEKKADCLLVSNYRVNNIAKDCEKYKLTTLATGVDMDFSFAVRQGEGKLYSILSKVTGVVPGSMVNSALSYYSTEDVKVTFSDFLRDNFVAVAAVLAGVVAVILALVLWSMHAEKRAAEGEQLISAVERDDLTGLYNKNFFFEYAQRLFKEHPDKKMDCVAMNIEHFHSVNELSGWDFGDTVLRALGREARAFLKENEGICGRIESDRFGMVCAPQTDYQSLLDRFQSKLDELSGNVNIRLRMGVMPWQEGLEPMQLFDRARTACTQIRGSDKHLMVYNEEMRAREDRDHRLLNDLARAVAEREFRVYYQPKYDIQCEPARLVSAEALIRWQHPELGLLSPAEFVPLFESNGQISRVDRYVWAEAAAQVAAWHQEFGRLIPVSVNLSRLDVLDPDLENMLDDLVQRNGLDCKALKLEVTESAYTDSAQELTAAIHRLRARGYEIEMDDFGSGYSSLNMLSAMPIDVLKMDSAFIRNIEHSEKDVRLVELVLDIARNLQVPVVAEGVETERQLRMLKQAGCALVQGYYFSRPVPPEEFAKLITADAEP